MGTAVSDFSRPAAAVFLLAENRLLREALLRNLSTTDDIRVVGSGPFATDILEQIVSAQANVVVLDSVSPAFAQPGIVHQLSHLDPAVRVVKVDMDAEEDSFLRVIQAGALGYVLRDSSAVEVSKTIRAAAAGEAACPASVLLTMDLNL